MCIRDRSTGTPLPQKRVMYATQDSNKQEFFTLTRRLRIGFRASVLALVMLLGGMVQGAFAQNRQISGTVFDASGVPLPGTSVKIKGTVTGTISDANGKYSVQAANNATLVFSYIGYISQEVLTDSRSVYDVTLQADASALSEVVVVGYGTQKKVNLSGSVATVSGVELTQRPVPNMQNLLHGRVAGLDIIQSTGEPGRDDASFQMCIRDRSRGVACF